MVCPGDAAGQTVYIMDKLAASLAVSKRQTREREKKERRGREEREESEKRERRERKKRERREKREREGGRDRWYITDIIVASLAVSKL